MKEILVVLPVEDRHKTYLENAAAEIQDSEEMHFTYRAQKEVTQKMVESADIILGNVPPGYLGKALHLQLVQLGSAGAAEYIKPGIIPAGAKLANATGAYGLAISEHMLGMVLMLMKKLNHYQNNMKAHDWKDEGQVKTIAGSVTLVVGMGDIGGEFARKMNALGSHVIGIRRNKAQKPDFLEGLYQMDALDDLLGKADIVACSLPGTKETERMFNKERLDKMKKGAILLNVGRGSLIPTEDLCEALKSGKLGGAAVDVTETEPLPANSPLWDAPNLLITPHVSGNYHAAQILETIVEIAAYNLRQVLSGGNIKNEVDFQTGYRRFCEPAENRRK
ncbi:phosphoglycerate dehydrogenase-like enzyme [Muricomes intestini]|uniref:Phosphoglycerate dehydrogenase-like enzyme n=1 Tax=Muricomes intestini TaxID=1796634 RepID=A0A4R3KAA2_9FIRM|nr:D-2-hydroxyacid dehydrogenase [Muricomes intestini]TCS79875.1 phosphoglycerate dehydrogenase-like enzyme [Muricomes intestini]